MCFAWELFAVNRLISYPEVTLVAGLTFFKGVWSSQLVNDIFLTCDSFELTGFNVTET